MAGQQYIESTFRLILGWQQAEIKQHAKVYSTLAGVAR